MLYIAISRDLGRTWQDISPSASMGESGYIKVSISADGQHIAAIARTFMYTTADGGESWAARGLTDFSTQWIDVTVSDSGLRILAVQLKLDNES